MDGHPCQRRLLSLSRHFLLDSQLPSPSLRVAQMLQNHTISAGTCIDNGKTGDPVVIGGMVLDIYARPYSTQMPGTTTPGEVQYIQGGVARNIAECMAMLGMKPFIISVLGHDMAGNMLLKHWSSLGLPTEGILMIQSAASSVVINMFDSDGELASAVASVGTVEKYLSHFWIENFRCKIQSSPILMVDANLDIQSIKYACQIAEGYGVPVWFEPVSVIKSERYASVIKYITFVSPNEHELIAMANALSSGSECYSYDALDENGKRLSPEAIAHKLKPAICLLLDQGIKVVVVTLGPDGVMLCSREDPEVLKLSTCKVRSVSLFQMYEYVSGSCSSLDIFNTINSRSKHDPYALHLPALPASVASLTGAGDCFVGGVVASMCSGLDLIQSMAVAISVAKAAIETKHNVPSEFSLKKIAGEARQVCSAAKMFMLG